MIDPRNLTLVQWCDATTLDLSTYMQVPRIQNEAGWRRWAEDVISDPSLEAYHPPDPRGFSHWRDWASRFVQAVPL